MQASSGNARRVTRLLINGPIGRILQHRRDTLADLKMQADGQRYGHHEKICGNLLIQYMIATALVDKSCKAVTISSILRISMLLCNIADCSTTSIPTPYPKHGTNAKLLFSTPLQI